LISYKLEADQIGEPKPIPITMCIPIWGLIKSHCIACEQTLQLRTCNIVNMSIVYGIVHRNTQIKMVLLFRYIYGSYRYKFCEKCFPKYNYKPVFKILSIDILVNRHLSSNSLTKKDMQIWYYWYQANIDIEETDTETNTNMLIIFAKW